MYFYVLRDEARRRTADRINRRIGIDGQKHRWSGLTLSSIVGDENLDALAFARNEWPKHYGDHTHNGFPEPWDKLYHRYYPGKDFFDLAIWQEVEGKRVLVALALGNPSHARTHLTIKWIERYFGKNYLAGRALWPILTCAEEYAKLLGSERVLLKDPVDSAKYERYGYEPYCHPCVSRGRYLAKELTDV